MSLTNSFWVLSLIGCMGIFLFSVGKNEVDKNIYIRDPRGQPKALSVDDWFNNETLKIEESPETANINMTETNPSNIIEPEPYHSMENNSKHEYESIAEEHSTQPTMFNNETLIIEESPETARTNMTVTNPSNIIETEPYQLMENNSNHEYESIAEEHSTQPTMMSSIAAVGSTAPTPLPITENNKKEYKSIEEELSSSAIEIIHNTPAEKFHDYFYSISEGFCKNIKQHTIEVQESVVFDIAVDCGEVFRESYEGTGSWMFFYYQMRLAVLSHGNSGLVFTCTDKDDNLKDSILPWVAGWFPRDFRQKWEQFYGNDVPNFWSVCGGENNNGHYLKHIIPIWKHDLRRMAIGLIGLPPNDPNHPSVQYAHDFLKSRPRDFFEITGGIYDHVLNYQEPILPNIEMDDVVIHFRCGDMIFVPHPGFRFYKYKYYSQYISPEAKTIGILTQPFTSSPDTTARKTDNVEATGGICQQIVYGLVEYLQSKFPNASIRIHNGPHESPVLALARMVMANETIASSSSLSTFSSIGSFGKIYIPHQNHMNAWMHWLIEAIDNKIDFLKDNNIELTYEENLHIEVLVSRNLFTNADGTLKMLEWFKNDALTVGDITRHLRNLQTLNSIEDDSRDKDSLNEEDSPDEDEDKLDENSLPVDEKEDLLVDALIYEDM